MHGPRRLNGQIGHDPIRAIGTDLGHPVARLHAPLDQLAAAVRSTSSASSFHDRQATRPASTAPNAACVAASRHGGLKQRRNRQPVQSRSDVMCRHHRYNACPVRVAMKMASAEPVT